jgi:threonine synthase
MSLTTAPRPIDLDTLAGLPTALVCGGCGHAVAEDEPIRLSCPRALPGDDTDHVLRRRLQPSRLTWPTDDDPNPFIRYRTLFHAYHAARAVGSSDGDIVRLIRRLDQDVARVDGHGFRVTPFGPAASLGEALALEPDGAIIIKDETGNVSGSHKARHLFGTLLELELAGGPAQSANHPLAIASCGNAALAAAVVARAAGRRLLVFVPPDADAAVMRRLTALGAAIEVCERRAGVAGDPTYLRLNAALRDGAIAFTCQGNLNGLAIEGGETLGWEMVSQLASVGRRLDHVVIQVGGGALAASVIQAFVEARDLGAIATLPRFHTVQTRGAHPLARAHERLLARLGPEASAEAIDRELRWAATHRSAFMWPWETEPRSLAGGILDDETYDWLAVVEGMTRTGGRSIVVGEAAIREANRLAHALTGIDVDPTGSAGLAGAISLLRRGDIGPADRTAVIFTGVRRLPISDGVQS